VAQIVTNAIDTYAALFRQPAAQAVAWALLQFVWQGAAVGAVTAAALFALRRSAADIRYVVASISLAVMFTLPVVSGVQRYQTLTRRASFPVSSESAPSLDRSQPNRSDSVTVVQVRMRFGASLDRAAGAHGVPLSSILLLGWLAGVLLLTLRLLTGWIWMQRIRTHGVEPIEPAWERVLTRLCRQLHITRRIALFESTGVDVPTVIGWLKPVVLLPASALSALSPAQLEAILAHELAHIRRHDYLVNLLQTLVETLLFYHPAVWWVSRRIRIERENCCDDLAVSLCGDPVAYANALADLESLRSSIPQPGRLDRTVVAATGGSLLRRVRRLLGAPAAHAGSRPAWLASSAALLIAAAITVSAGDVRAVRPETRLQQQNQDSRLAAAPVPMPPTPMRPTPMRPTPMRPARVPAPAVATGTAATPASSERPIAAAMSTAALGQSISQSSSDSRGSWSWSDNGERLQVDYSGTFDFTDDDTDVQQMSAGGYLKISDGAWLGRHSVEISERAGRLERRYFVNGLERPFEPEGRAWLQQNLPRFVRKTGIAAPSRVARFLKSGGVPAVLAEIARIDGNYARGIYYRELFKQATLTPEQYRQVLAQASSTMKDSNYELARLLITIADRLPDDEASRTAYFAAASNISSAYEAHRVYSAMLKKGPVSPQVLAGILDHVRSLHSDYEVAELLRQILAQQPLDDRNRAAFFAAVETIHGSYERHRVLIAALRADGTTSPAVLEAILTQAGSMTGDHERSALLLEVLKQNSIEGALRTPFFRAVDGIHVGYERGRVLNAVVAKPDVSRDTLKLAIQETRDLPSYEASRLLIAIAGRDTITGDLRDAYIEAADRLSSYEQGQAMTALVRSERRSR
jgi:beta-lactamase regulating signal transducer with metallopeptidase domain